MPSQDRERDASSGCLLRLIWLVVGNMALMLVGVQLFLHPRGWFSVLDAAYWSIVVLILAARYADMRYCNGTTADGKPCTPAIWRRHTVVLVLLACVVWLAAHSLGALGLSP